MRGCSLVPEEVRKSESIHLSEPVDKGKQRDCVVYKKNARK